jgi:hypothetical protein
VAGSLWFTLELPKITVLMQPIYREMGLLPALEGAIVSSEQEAAL